MALFSQLVGKTKAPKVDCCITVCVSVCVRMIVCMCVCVRGCGRCLNNCLAHCRQFGDDLRSVVPPPPPPPGPFATFQSGIAIVSHALRVLGKTISFFSARRGYVLYSCKTSIFKTLFFEISSSQKVAKYICFPF